MLEISRNYNLRIDMPIYMRILIEILNYRIYDNRFLEFIRMFMTFYVKYFSPFFGFPTMPFYWMV